MFPDLHKWDTANPASGEPRYAIRYWDADCGQWIIMLNHRKKGFFATEAERDELLSKIEKKRGAYLKSQRKLN